jgi:hypothetical protein
LMKTQKIHPKDVDRGDWEVNQLGANISLITNWVLSSVVGSDGYLVRFDNILATRLLMNQLKTQLWF